MQLNTNTSTSHNAGSQISIGNQTSFSVAPTLPFDYAIKNGFDAFEWFPDKKAPGIGWDIDDINAEMRLYIKKTAHNHNVRLSVHVPWWANPLIPESNEVMFGCFKFADDINATLVNTHLYTENGLEDYVKSILPFIKRSKELNIKIAIENTPLTVPDDFNKLFIFLGNQNGIEIKHVGMCLDIGHANLCELTRNDYIGFLDQIAPEVPIIHLHLHENYGDQDNHLPLFTGPSRSDGTGIHTLLKRLKERMFSGSIILEQWPQPPSLLNHARNKLYDIFRNGK